MIIDVSEHNGVLNWGKLKPQIEGAILRCGYGSDKASQDDKQIEDLKASIATAERRIK